MGGEAIFKLSSSGPTVPGRGWGASGSPVVTASQPGSASICPIRKVMSTFLPDPPLPPPLGSWPGHPVLCTGLCLGYLWGTGQGIGDLRGQCGGGASLGKFLTAPGKQACMLLAPLSMDQGHQFIHPGSRREAHCGALLDLLKVRTCILMTSGASMHSRGPCTEAARPRLGPRQTTYPAQPSNHAPCLPHPWLYSRGPV